MSDDALRAEVTALLKVADFAPTPTQMEEIVAAWPHVKAMLGRIDRSHGFADEPAHIFDPTRF